MEERRKCPICHVESSGGRVCTYHHRNRKRDEQEAQKYRAKFYAQLLCEYVDEARSPTGP